MVRRKTEIKLDRTATSIKRFSATVFETRNCGFKSATETRTAALGTRELLWKECSQVPVPEAEDEVHSWMLECEIMASVEIWDTEQETSIVNCDINWPLWCKME